MSGEQAVTSGESAPRLGMAGLHDLARRLSPFWTAFIGLAVIGVVVGAVNVSSILIEAHRSGADIDVWRPATWEGTSFLVILALSPLIGLAVLRWPVNAQTLWPNLAIHAALTIAFSLVHVAAMVGLRKLIYAQMGESYDFSHGALTLEFIYEWRKDVLSYVGIAFGFWLAARIASGPPANLEPKAGAGAQQPARLALRVGGTTLYLAPADIISVDAAGNYVEIHYLAAAGDAKSALVRGTLARYEADLAPHGLVRVHRARLVNRAHVRAMEATSAGDAALTLSDGRVVNASRRYRAALEA